MITTNGTHSRVDISLTHRINLHNFVYQYFYSDHHCRYLVTDKAVLYNIYNHTLTVYTYWHLHKDSFIRYLQSYSHSVYVLASSQRQFYTIFTIILSQCIRIGIFTKTVLYNIYNHTLTVYTYWHLHKDSFIRYLQSYSHSVYVLASSQRQFYTIFTIILSQCIRIGIFTKTVLYDIYNHTLTVYTYWHLHYQ